jgi:mannose-1-phosphate guanylyltransferase
MNIVPIILSGGKGTRLWPLSRSMRPKQFINLIGGESLFQTTINRVKCIDGITDPIVVCNEEHRFMVAEQLQELDSGHNAIILEPAGRNTAPAIASAAYKLSLIDNDEDVCMLVLPADHIIEDSSALSVAVASALESAKNGRFVTFGISPDKPATGYGYLKVSNSEADSVVKNVDAFIEKPNLATATEYVNSGNYFWNGGMFLMKVSTFLEELEAAEPEMCRAIKASVSAAQIDLDFFRLEQTEYEKSPNISVDYALMEKSSRVSMVELNAGWNDIGSWSSLWEAGAKDESGNVTKGDVMLEAVKNCYVHSESRLLSAIGVKDLIIVETHDGIMVSSKKHDQDIKQIVARLQKEGRTESELHRKAFRPWGNYDCLDKGERFQVKRIMVKPGQCTSMQKHFQRAEHWIVVSGTAEVTCGDKIFLLKENESTFIPLGAQHRLKNPGKTDLELIEVQSGAYLGEDDIVRINDEYGRK